MVALVAQLLKLRLIAGDLNVMEVSSTVRDAGRYKLLVCPQLDGIQMP